MLTGPDDVITAALGLRIALRGAQGDPSGWDLAVAAVSPVRLPASTPLEAFAGDGSLLRRLWSLEDRLVIDFCEGVAVEVLDADGSVTFDRLLPPDLEQHLLLDHILPLVLARRGELVLHGGVLTRHDSAALLIGSSGAGKSTLTAFAARCEWSVGGDDGAVLRLGAHPTVEPTYSTIRLVPNTLRLLDMAPDEGVEVASKRRLESAAGKPFRQDPALLTVVAQLEPVPAHHPASFTRVRGIEAHSTLMRSTFHAELGPGRLLRNVVAGLAEVAETVTVGRLSVPRGRAGLAAAERCLRSELAP